MGKVSYSMGPIESRGAEEAEGVQREINKKV